MLGAGESVVSCGGPCGQLTLVMQGDGNLVLYLGPAVLWASGTNAPGAYVAMQGDGNLVVYAPSCAPNGVCWSSETAGYPGAHLAVQGDGNLVIYGPSCSGGNGDCWASGSSAVCN
jgi:hypothetical protein